MKFRSVPVAVAGHKHRGDKTGLTRFGCQPTQISTISEKLN